MFNLLPFSSKPNIKRLAALNDIDGLLKALSYAQEKAEALRQKYKYPKYEDAVRKYYPEAFTVSVDAAVALANLKVEKAILPVIKAFTGGIEGGIGSTEWEGYYFQPNNIASHTLAQFGEKAVDYLIAELDKNHPQYRDWEAAALGHIGSLKAVPALIRNAHHNGHWATTWALGQIGGGKDVIEFLIADLLGNNRDDVTAALNAFAQNKFTVSPNEFLATTLNELTKNGITDNRYKVLHLAEALCGLHDSIGLEMLIKIFYEREKIHIALGDTYYIYLALFDDPRVKEILACRST